MINSIITLTVYICFFRLVIGIVRKGLSYVNDDCNLV